MCGGWDGGKHAQDYGIQQHPGVGKMGHLQRTGCRAGCTRSWDIGSHNPGEQKVEEQDRRVQLGGGRVQGFSMH